MRSRLPAPWRPRRLPLVLPAFRLLPLLAVGALCCYGGLLLDDRTLMAAAVAAVAMPAVDLLAVAAQCVAVRGRRHAGTGRAGSGAPTSRHRPIAGLTAILTPGGLRRRDRWERLDQDGGVLARLTGPPPDDRGLYRRVGAVLSWRSPLGLLSVRLPVARSGEVLRLPQPAGRDDGRHAVPDRRRSGRTQTEESGGVRDYRPGDPLRLVSWRHTAHLGDLMVRETGGRTRARTLLALDVPDGMAPDRLDAVVAAALPVLPGSGGGTGRIAVTDGRGTRQGVAAARRFLAALTAPARAGETSSASSSASSSVPSSVVPSADPSPGPSAPPADPSAEARAEAVGRLLRADDGPVRLLIATDDPDGAFPKALSRRSPVTPTVLPAPAQASFAPSETETEDAVPAASSPASRSAVPDRLRRPVPRRPRPSLASRRTVLGEVVLAVSSLAFLAVTTAALRGLVAGGLWTWYLGVAGAVVVLDARIPWRTPARGALRFLGCAAALVVAGVALAAVRLHDCTGLWPSGIMASDCDGAACGPAGLADMALRCIRRGFTSLNRQLPPLDVTAYGDLFLLGLLIPALLLLRLLLTGRRAVPLLAVLPVVALAADYSLVGHVAGWPSLAALALAVPASLWAVRPAAARPPLAALAALVAAAVTLGATPAATSLAYRVPLSLGDGGGLLSTNTISPLVDLRRTLDSPSGSIVLTYRAARRMPLRLSTLSDFDGDTWRFDDALARDGGFYGAGIRLGVDADEAPDRQERTVVSPLVLYRLLASDSVAGQDGGTGQDGAAPSASTDAADAALFAGLDDSADVVIETLRSRFLPVPSGTVRVEQAGPDWLTYSDGTVYNRTGSTSQRLTYRTYGLAPDPVTDAAGIDRIDEIGQAGRRLFDNDRSDAVQARRNAEGTLPGARIRDGWLLLDGHADADGRVTLADGTPLGTFRQVGAPVLGPDGTWEQAGDIDVDSSLARSLDLRQSDTYAVGYHEADIDRAGVTLAMPVDPTADSAWQSGSISGISVDERWYAFALSQTSRTDATALSWFRRLIDRSARQARRDATALPSRLPASVRDVVRRARAVGAGHDGGREEQLATMRWLVSYFTDPDEGFAYSLDAPDGDGRDNLDVIGDFLDPDGGHTGYCTHYAAALAILGRALGVPTRIALGYSAGDGGTVGGAYRVTAGQLHAWTEAYIDDVGWTPFDVTPASDDGTEDAADDAADDEPRMVITTMPDGSGTDRSGRDAAADASRGATDVTGDDMDRRASGGGTDGRRRDGRTSPATVAALAAAGLTAALALAAAPFAVSAVRRRRMLAALEAAARADGDAGDAGGEGGGTDAAALRARAWRLAWRRLSAPARRTGRDRSLTDLALADRLAEGLDPEGAAALRAAARAADAAAFGGTPPPVTRRDVEAIRRLTETGGRRPRRPSRRRMKP